MIRRHPPYFTPRGTTNEGYSSYYNAQFGNGVDVYSGRAFQNGHGFGGALLGLMRSATPFLKTGRENPVPRWRGRGQGYDGRMIFHEQHEKQRDGRYKELGRSSDGYGENSQESGAQKRSETHEAAISSNRKRFAV